MGLAAGALEGTLTHSRVGGLQPWLASLGSMGAGAVPPCTLAVGSFPQIIIPLPGAGAVHSWVCREETALQRQPWHMDARGLTRLWQLQ